MKFLLLEELGGAVGGQLISALVPICSSWSEYVIANKFRSNSGKTLIHKLGATDIICTGLAVPQMSRNKVKDKTSRQERIFIGYKEKKSS